MASAAANLSAVALNRELAATTCARPNVVGISLDCAAALSARGKRTWWRKIESGKVTKLDPDHMGRTRVSLDEALATAVINMSGEDVELLLLADAGDPDAQDDIGQLFLQARIFVSAHYWLNLAAKQGHPNSMQVLSGCYARGDGVEKDERAALKWLRSAAARGHSIALLQLSALRGASANSGSVPLVTERSAAPVHRVIPSM